MDDEEDEGRLQSQQTPQENTKVSTKRPANEGQKDSGLAPIT